MALAVDDEDAEEVSVWAARLLAELSEADDAQVEAVADKAPDGAKGAGALVGALLARVTNLDALKALLGAARGWATRTGRTVKVSIDGDTLELTGASREQQDHVIEAWLARHAPAA